ncbi:nucleoside hydrolase [Ilumatobacter sp.]|uniref:nucleoside hydrolase n=1 Tax=Ilumatobacter sp. TaxID=1967498 RepID=UPI003B5178DA
MTRPGTVGRGRRPLLVDTDGGIDDATALWWLLDRGDVDVVGVTIVHGNVAPDVAAANVGRVLDAHGRDDVRVAIGAAVPYGPAPLMRPADFIHGTDGLGETFRPEPSERDLGADASALIGRLVDDHGGRLEILTLGPLTNLAHALDDVDDLAARVASITVMGGVVEACGNAQPFSEANVANDPSAAQRVVTGGWTDATLVGLDVTHRATFTTELFALVDGRRTDAGAFLSDPLRFYRRFGGTFCAVEGECPCHDLLAAMVAVVPAMVDGPVLPLAVQDTPGPAWGSTIADRRQPFFERAGEGSEQNLAAGFAPWRCALSVDVEAFRDELVAMFGG